MDACVRRHERDPLFMGMMSDLSATQSGGDRNEWLHSLYDFSTQQAQNDALTRLMPKFKQLLCVQKIQDSAPRRLSDQEVYANYHAGVANGVPGFNACQAPREDWSNRASMGARSMHNRSSWRGW